MVTPAASGSTRGGMPGGQADFAAQCLFGVPEACDQSVIDSSSDLPLTITAQQGTVRGEYQAEFRGEISAWQGQWRLFADSLWLNNTLPRILQARGQVHYQDPLIHLWADHAHYLPDNKQLLMTGMRYQWVGRQGRGQAKQLEQSEHLRVIQDGDFTTCPPGDRSWQVKGAKIVIDNQRQIASIWHARWLLREFTEQINKKQKTFSELARRYSQDPGSAAKGGDLGWADPTIYEPKFAEVLQQLRLIG